MYTYKQKDVVLTVGIDENGRIFSHMQKNGETVARDIYIKIPTETDLAKQGWTRFHDG